ncbi:MAG TPA: hypothetical protein VKT32_10585, partial [Chthonomonadaceae bacterium]|nr:hypothetical protein [Chthonomonadaceae bacterium]
MPEEAERLDTDAWALAGAYRRFVAQGLHVGWSDRQPLAGKEFCEALAILAEGSGAFGFLALQQFVANTSLAGCVPQSQPWPVVGVAFGHLRAPSGPAPQWDGARASGPVPWMTGAGIFGKVLLGLRGPGGAEVYALADATDRPAFRHSAPMDLIAGAGTATVSVQLRDLPIAASAVLKTDPPGALARGDAQSVLYQTPLMLGCARACLELIRRSER